MEYYLEEWGHNLTKRRRDFHSRILPLRHRGRKHPRTVAFRDADFARRQDAACGGNVENVFEGGARELGGGDLPFFGEEGGKGGKLLGADGLVCGGGGWSGHLVSCYISGRGMG